MSESRKAGSQSQGQGGEPDAKRDLSGLLSGLMGGQMPQGGSSLGSQEAGFPSGGEGNEVADLLGGLLGSSGSQASGGLSAPSGGMPPQNPASMGTGGDDLTNLLGSLLGGAGAGGMPQSMPQEDFSSAGGGDMASILGSLLGGGMTQASSSQQTSGMGGSDLMGSLMGSLLGGGSGSSSAGGGMGDLLGSLIGSSQASNTVSQQTGLAPSLVQALLPMLIGLLFRGDKRSGARGGVDIDGDGIPDNSDQLMGLMQRVQQGEQVDLDEIRSSGYTRALARQSGYSVDEVAPATVKILEALAQQQR